jgi:hypothetical protein
MREKIIKQTDVLSEKIGGFEAAKNAFDFNKVSPIFRDMFDGLINDYKRQRDFLRSLLPDLDRYCEDCKTIAEHGTVNWID